MTRQAGADHWTPQQRKAIVHRGTDVFVAASAGTGKTAVLTSRCAQILSDRTICPSVLNVLVVTFTEAAAEQMRTRIRQQIEQQIAADPANRHLANQALLLPAADISTIHAFCKRLLTEHFFELGLDGGFRVIDPDEQTLLKAEALDRTLLWAWDQPDLQQGLEALFNRRVVNRFAAKIVRVSHFLDGLVDRRHWLDCTLDQAALADVSGTHAASRQRQTSAETLARLSRQIHWLHQRWQGAGLEGEFPGLEIAEQIDEAAEMARLGRWDELAAHLRSVDSPGKPKDDEPGLSFLLRRGIFQAGADLTALAGLALFNPDYSRLIRPQAQLQGRTMVTLVSQFDDFYGRLKSQHNGLDFADLEHYALRLLTHPDEPGQPSDTALILRNRYKAIFVDEYQDINPVQQAILDRLRGTDNVFGVGDVKQSIYAFRGAEPSIFLEYLRPTADRAAQDRGLRVDLNVNFRSRQGILDFVNELFTRIMTESHAGLDYDESARLSPAPGSPQTGEPAVELHLVDEPEANDTPEALPEANPRRVTDRQRQAALVARRIQELMGRSDGHEAMQILDPDTGQGRPLQYRDIVILLRSPAGRVQDYERILRRAGIPVVAPSAGFLVATEVQDCLNLLKILDNPYRDIEMAAVLRSPLFSVTDTELARIKLHTRQHGRRLSFYEAFVHCSSKESGEDGADRLAGIREKLESWRQLARVTPLAEVLWQMYEETGLTSFVLALPEGKIRRANLLKLHERAIQFDRFGTSQGFVSLGRFVEFVEKLQGAGADWGSAEPQGVTQDAVRIQSVHKSKGLEFPVVILAELDAEFNRSDLSEDVLCDREDLLGLQVMDPQRGIRSPSMEHQVVAARIGQRDLAEEMRVLYVAVTRARDRLVLTGVESGRRCRDTVLLGLAATDRDMAAGWVSRFKSPLHWILFGCANTPELGSALHINPAGDQAAASLMTVTVYGKEEVEGLSKIVNRLSQPGERPQPLSQQTVEPEAALLAPVQARVQWRYPYEQACLCPAKVTVTGWIHQQRGPGAGAAGPLLGIDDFGMRIRDHRSAQNPQSAIRNPQSLVSASQRTAQSGLASRQGSDALLVGTAAHLVLSSVPLDQPVTDALVRQTLARLVKEDVLSDAIARQVKPEAIVGFFKGTLGRMAQDPANQVLREWPFTMRVPALELTGQDLRPRDCEGEFVVVQGVADLVVVTADGAVVVDFKTDRPWGDLFDARKELYTRQLLLYTHAVQTILGISVIAKWVYYLADEQAVLVT